MCWLRFGRWGFGRCSWPGWSFLHYWYGRGDSCRLTNQLLDVSNESVISEGNSPLGIERFPNVFYRPSVIEGLPYFIPNSQKRRSVFTRSAWLFLLLRPFCYALRKAFAALSHVDPIPIITPIKGRF